MPLRHKIHRETVRITVPAEIRRTFEAKGRAHPSVQSGTKSSESSVGDARQAYNELKRSIYDGLLIVDDDARIIEVNSRAGQLLGYTHEEFLRLKVTQVIDGADESLLRSIRQNVRQGSFTLIEASCLRKGGDDFPAEIASHEIRFGDSAKLCFFIRDISERIEMEQDLVRLSRAVESASDAITITDEENETVFRNAAFRALFGDSAGSTEKAQGGFADLFGDEAVAVEMQNALRSGQAWSTEIDVKLPDERLVSTLCRADAIRLDNDNDSFGTVAILTDITEQKNTERRLQTARDDLAHSNAELEQFAFVASHDLKEPLRAIAGYLQLLSRRYSSSLDDQAADYIRHAVEGAERMRKLINHVLDYSRLDRPAGPARLVSVNTILTEALGNIRGLVSEKHAQIIAKPLPQIRATPTQLVQVFQNIIGNALKFCTESPPRVEIWADRSAGSWVFHLRDNGIGIDEGVQDRVFMLFQRLHTRDEYEGTGIGLATCKKIIEQHGGRIWIECSATGKGTTFAFSIPEAAGEQGARQSKASEENGNAPQE